MNPKESLTRRKFLEALGTGAVGILAAACARPEAKTAPPETRNPKDTPELGWLGWLNVVSPDNLYTINYPATWWSPDVNSKFQWTNNIISFYSPEETPTGYPITEVQIGWWNISNGRESVTRKYKSLEEYVKTRKDNTMSFWSKDKRQVSPIAESRMKLDGQEAAVLQFTTKEEVKFYNKPYNKVSGHILILFIRGGRNWQIDWVSHGDEISIGKSGPIFDKMLSSFKFLK